MKLGEVWHRLQRVELLPWSIVVNGRYSGLDTMYYDFSENSLDVIARDTHLDDGESVAGWLFFTWQGENAKDVAAKLLRLTVFDSRGHVTTLEIEPPTPSDSDVSRPGRLVMFQRDEPPPWEMEKGDD